MHPFIAIKPNEGESLSTQHCIWMHESSIFCLLNFSPEFGIITVWQVWFYCLAMNLKHCGEGKEVIISRIKKRMSKWNEIWIWMTHFMNLQRINEYLQKWYKYLEFHLKIILIGGFHGVMVSTQDSDSCDPSSNLGGT